MTQQRALIFGASGQDGAYLSRWLLSQGYEVFAASRDVSKASFAKLRLLGIDGQVTTLSLDLGDPVALLRGLRTIEPSEIYNLSGQSSVGYSFDAPIETWQSNLSAHLNLLEAVRALKLPARIYAAGSSEAFGDTGGALADESHPFHPRSPYGSAKASTFWATKNYRDVFGLFACTGLLFNHESPLRPPRFVTRKVVQGAVAIAEGRMEHLVLGRLDIERDWGYAAEYVEAMWMMLQRPEPSDFVVATGVVHTLSDFVAAAFRACGLNWLDHVRSDPSLFRPNEIARNGGDPRKARDVLGWKARSSFEEVVGLMVESEKEQKSPGRDRP